MFCWRAQIIFFLGALSEDFQVFLLFSLRLSQGVKENVAYQPKLTPPNWKSQRYIIKLFK